MLPRITDQKGLWSCRTQRRIGREWSVVPATVKVKQRTSELVVDYVRYRAILVDNSSFKLSSLISVKSWPVLQAHMSFWIRHKNHVRPLLTTLLSVYFQFSCNGVTTKDNMNDAYEHTGHWLTLMLRAVMSALPLGFQTELRIVRPKFIPVRLHGWTIRLSRRIVSAFFSSPKNSACACAKFESPATRRDAIVRGVPCHLT